MRPSGHQVTPRLQAQVRHVNPHLCVLFRAGVSCDSSPSCASHVGVSCDSSPSRASRVGVSSDSPSRAFRAEASGPIAFARFSVEVYFMHREGALSPWMSERAESSTHGSRWWGAVIMWIRKCPLHTAAADEGLLSCELEKCPLHTAAADEGLLSCELEKFPLHTAAADEGLLSCEL